VGKTSIEWTEYSWNPIRARRKHDGHTLKAGKTGHYCQKCSPGCKNCYAETMNLRLGTGIGYTVPELAEVELYLDEKTLLEPLRWKKPKQVFVCSMTDLFADFVSDEWIEKIYAVMALADKHTFMTLTKRPARRLRWNQGIEEEGVFHEGFRGAMVEGQAQSIYSKLHPNESRDAISMWLAVKLPLKNVREGTSVCTQKEADEKIPITVETPAVLPWLSIEPILEDIDVSYPKSIWPDGPPMCCSGQDCGCRGMPIYPPLIYGIKWVVVGGESGVKARTTSVEAIRRVVGGCKQWNVPVFVKQMGRYPSPAPGMLWSLADAKGGNMAEWPEDLKVRQLP
jgi:protein gp37